MWSHCVLDEMLCHFLFRSFFAQVCLPTRIHLNARDAVLFTSCLANNLNNFSSFLEIAIPNERSITNKMMDYAPNAFKGMGMESRVTSKKSPNVCKSCPKLISLEK